MNRLQFGTHRGVITRGVLVAAAVAVIAIPVLTGAAAAPQSSTGLKLPDPTRTFEAASVRQNKSGEMGSSSQSGNGRLTVRNMPLKSIILQAFPVQSSQIIGGPGWLTTDRFDIVAKAAATTSDADLKLMMQNLLIERFAMKAHVEARDTPIYALVLARPDGKLGPNLQPARCETYTSGQPCGAAPGIPGDGRGSGGGGGGGGGMMTAPSRGGSPGVATMSSQGSTMEGLANLLSRPAGRTVVDRTGLTGRFEMQLRYTTAMTTGTEGAAAPNAPELFTAIQEQWGLKLDATRGPVDVLVIDSAEHPVNDDFVIPENERPAPPPPLPAR